MLQGTSSNVGKSIVTAALCRILKQDGYNVAPFKAQNMALNSFVTKDGGEMGRAQVIQAEAAMIEPHVNMNPILLKPTSNTGSQVVVLGKAVATMKAREYHDEYAKKAFPIITEALETLSKEYEVLVIEGAGSPAEINLKKTDIVNMSVAKHLNAPVLLIADIDRGGALASLIGTLMLLDEDEKALVKGFIINKFRGDVKLLEPGLVFLEEKTGIPVLGVLNYIENIDIDDEDSVGLENKYIKIQKDINIAVLRTPKISNFTDFSALEAEKDVSVYYVRTADELGDPDMIVIPGTKNTTSDLLFLKETGIEKEIIRKNKKGVPVIGICGGYQMLGEKIFDPEKTESEITEMAGLGLLPLATTFFADKITQRVTAKADDLTFLDLNMSFSNMQGYEIHMGRSEYTQNIKHAFTLDRNGEKVFDGAVRSDNLVMGTYMHGIFDNDDFRHALLNELRKRKGLSSIDSKVSMQEIKENAYNKLADSVRRDADIEKIYKIMGLK